MFCGMLVEGVTIVMLVTDLPVVWHHSGLCSTEHIHSESHCMFIVEWLGAHVVVITLPGVSCP
jgi:hypothetical protein